jgi:hypothetical protein
MPSIRIDGNQKHPRPYWPKELVREGFVGELEILNDAVTATIIHPNVSLEQVKRSLQLAQRSIDLRIEREAAEEKIEPK